MSATVGSNLFSNTWNTVYKAISGNVVDPQGRTGSPWIFADFPMAQEGKRDTFPGYPIVTIEPFQTETMNLTHGLNDTYSTITSMISVNTTNKRQIDVVSSDIWATLNENRGVFASSGMNHLMLSPGGVDTNAMDRDNKIHTKNLGVQFKVRL